ncbi:hypothetical protein HQ529_01135 [Candidatus Woesearchaeota archaeon]|nr:hypothetical protein [Candidatus Woesearchaeota archaeon]
MKNEKITTYAIIFVAALLLFNQYQLMSIQDLVSGGTGLVTKTKNSGVSLLGGKELSDVNIDDIGSTGHAIAALFPVEEIKTAQDAIDMMIPTGTPDYGEEMGVSYDDPVGSLEKLANAQRALLAGLSTEEKDRFLTLALKPVGISCEYCCGIGPVGIRNDGSSSCGCQHNPALLSLTMWLMQNTDYTDAEILKEVMKWKSIFFPKNMATLAMEVAGGDTSSLQDLRGMVGGC